MLDELVAKFQFWKSKNFVKLDRDYEFFLDLSNTQAMAIRILKKYPGVIFEITNIRMEEDNQMSYDQSIIANPNLCDVESKRFKDFTTAIFRSILIDSIESAKKGELNENRNANLVESDAERDLYEEGIAVSEERVSEREPRKKNIRRNKRVRSKVQ